MPFRDYPSPLISTEGGIYLTQVELASTALRSLRHERGRDRAEGSAWAAEPLPHPRYPYVSALGLTGEPDSRYPPSADRAVPVPLRRRRGVWFQNASRPIPLNPDGRVDSGVRTWTSRDRPTVADEASNTAQPGVTASPHTRSLLLSRGSESVTEARLLSATSSVSWTCQECSASWRFIASAAAGSRRRWRLVIAIRRPAGDFTIHGACLGRRGLWFLGSQDARLHR
jgi:hypothetical protein